MTQEEKNDVLHKITVMQAYVEGKTIETCDLCWNDDEEAWEELNEFDDFWDIQKD